ncbi:MAG: hypothetical protein ACOX8J_10660 [Candidatus Merdisoma sp.]
MLSPALGATVGSLERAKVPYNKWIRWVMPCFIMMFAACMVFLFILCATGWNG